MSPRAEGAPLLREVYYKRMVTDQMSLRAKLISLILEYGCTAGEAEEMADQIIAFEEIKGLFCEDEESLRKVIANDE